MGISNFSSEYKGPTVIYITSRYLEIQSISQIKCSHLNFLKVMSTYTCSHSRFSSDNIPLTFKSAFMEEVNYRNNKIFPTRKLMALSPVF